MKKIALISTFCDTDEKQNVLYENIVKLKEFGVDVMALSPNFIVLPQHIISACDYFFYTKDNPILKWPVRDFSFWKSIEVKNNWVTMHHNVPDYGWAALYQTKKLSQLALLFDYDIFYHLIYDVEVDEVIEDEIKSNNVNLLHPRQDPNNPEVLWESTLHFMVFDREMMEMVEKEITLESYLSTNGVAEGEVLKWKNKFNIPTSGHPVKDKIYYWGEKDFFNYSTNSNYKFFLGKNEETIIWRGEPIKSSTLNSNMRIFVYDYSQEKNIIVIINGKEYNDIVIENKILEFEETSDEIKTLIIKIDDDEYDLTKKYFEMSKNLIYYENN